MNQDNKQTMFSIGWVVISREKNKTGKGVEGGLWGKASKEARIAR